MDILYHKNQHVNALWRKISIASRSVLGAPPGHTAHAPEQTTSAAGVSDPRVHSYGRDGEGGLLRLVLVKHI